MQTIASLLQQDWIHSLGWTLLHSLWQYAFVAVVCALLLFYFKQFSANARYLIAFFSLLVSTLISLITFFKYEQANSEIVMRPVQHSASAQFFAEHNVFNLVSAINDHITGMVMVWLFGFLVCSLKIFVDFRYCQHIKNQQIIPTPEKWQHLFATLAAKVGMHCNIELRISRIITTPCVIGHLKPVVLLPMGLLLGMTQPQLEVILLHELAHARRHDYLVGLIQAVIKTLFFFNPFLYWISHQIDKEREHACDDVAIAVCQNPLLLANTLKELAEMNTNQKLTMNITGGKLVLTRITRIFNKKEKMSTAKNGLLASVLILVTSLAIAIGVNAEPESTNNKKISLDVTNISAQAVMTEVNKKCGTDEVVATKDHDEVTLLLENISCKDAIQLLKDFSAETPAQK